MPSRSILEREAYAVKGPVPFHHRPVVGFGLRDERSIAEPPPVTSATLRSNSFMRCSACFHRVWLSPVPWRRCLAHLTDLCSSRLFPHTLDLSLFS